MTVKGLINKNTRKYPISAPKNPIFGARGASRRAQSPPLRNSFADMTSVIAEPWLRAWLELKGKSFYAWLHAENSWSTLGCSQRVALRHVVSNQV